MWEKKAFGLNRQHHCRLCSKSVCHSCSPQTSALPVYGFEWPERMCKLCFTTITDEQRRSLCRMLPFRTPFDLIQFFPDRRELVFGVRMSIQMCSLDSVLGQATEAPPAGNGSIGRSSDSRQSERRAGRTIRPTKKAEEEPEQSLVQSILDGD
jgi:hypothetical protein